MIGGYIDKVEECDHIWNVYLCLWDEKQMEEQNLRVRFDHEPFAVFYTAATKRSFHKDYSNGTGRENVYRRIGGVVVELVGPFDNPEVAPIPHPHPEGGDD
jgi:hypothetical protein